MQQTAASGNDTPPGRPPWIGYRGSILTRFAETFCRHRRPLYALMGLTLAVCLLCPYVEWSVHSNQTIFQTGKDNETSIALFTLASALALVVADFARNFLPTAWLGVELPVWETGLSSPPSALHAAPLPAISPPPNLRI